MAEKRGLPKGKTNNPNGRPKGSKNKFSYDVKKCIYNTIANDGYVNGLLIDIDAVVEADKRAKLKLELIKLFVPRPLNDVEEKDKNIRSAIYNKLAGDSC